MAKPKQSKKLASRAIKPSKSKPSKVAPSALANTKESILQAATVLFAEKDYEGVSVREIAEKAKVNIALISYHFKNKDGLYTECLQNFGLSRSKQAKEILTPPQTKEEFKIRLEIFCKGMLASYSNDVHAVKILIREMDMDREKFRPVIKEYIEPIFYVCVDFFNEAIKKKIVNKKFEPLFLSYIVFSCLCHAANSEKPMKRNLGVSVKDAVVQDAIVNHIVHIMTEGVYS